jgi:hypothetical protein
MLWRGFGIGLLMLAVASTASAQYFPPAPYPYPLAEVPSNPWPGTPSGSTVTRTHPDGAVGPSRRVESRTRANGVETTRSIVERPDVEGRLRASVVTTIETVHLVRMSSARALMSSPSTSRAGVCSSSRSSRSRRSVPTDRLTSFGTRRHRSNRRPTLTVPRDRAHEIGLSDVRETETSIFQPGFNQALVETERVHQRERQLVPVWFDGRRRGRYAMPTESSRRPRLGVKTFERLVPPNLGKRPFTDSMTPESCPLTSVR